MKKLFIMVLMMSVISTGAFAQPQPGQMPPGAKAMMEKMQNMTPAEREAFMNSMQQQATKMQNCMKENGGLQGMEAKAKEMQAHINTLCAAGNRVEAQTYAMEKGRELANDPQIKKMQECSKDMMDSMPMMKNMVENHIHSAEQKNICDMQHQMNGQ